MLDGSNGSSGVRNHASHDLGQRPIKRPGNQCEDRQNDRTRQPAETVERGRNVEIALEYRADHQAYDKRRARLNCIAHLLDLVPYRAVPRSEIELPKRSNKGKYADQVPPRRVTSFRTARSRSVLRRTCTPGRAARNSFSPASVTYVSSRLTRRMP